MEFGLVLILLPRVTTSTITITTTLIISITSIATGTGTAIVQAWLSLYLSLLNLSNPQLKHKLNSAPIFLLLLPVKSPMVAPWQWF